MSNAAGNAFRDAFGTVPEAEAEADRRTTSSRNDAQTRGRAHETALTARLRSIDPVDATTVAVLTLRPDWRPEHVHAVLTRDRRPWRDVVTAALRAALDPDTRTPARIENHDGREYEPTPVPPTLAEHRSAQRCDHGAVAGLCALCRHTTPHRETS